MYLKDNHIKQKTKYVCIIFWVIFEPFWDRQQTGHSHSVFVQVRPFLENTVNTQPTLGEYGAFSYVINCYWQPKEAIKPYK